MFNEKMKKICENLGWDIYISSGYVDLSKYSPVGEDFSFSVSVEDFINDVNYYATSFDEEEHIEMLVDAKKSGISGIPSIKELVKDAAAIKETLIELSDALIEKTEA